MPESGEMATVIVELGSHGYVLTKARCSLQGSSDFALLGFYSMWENPLLDMHLSHVTMGRLG